MKKKQTEIIKYNKDLSSCVIDDVLVVDGIVPDEP